jgi:hypothetical protein
MTKPTMAKNKPKPLLSATIKPKPTRTAQCLTDLLDNNVRTTTKRKRDEASVAARDHHRRVSSFLCSRSSSRTTTAAAAMTAPRKKPVSNATAIVDIFGSMIQSGPSSSLLRLATKSSTCSKKMKPAADPTKVLTLRPTLSSRADSTHRQQPIATGPSLSSSSQTSMDVVLAKRRKIQPPSRYVTPKIRPPPPSSYSTTSTMAVAAKQHDATLHGKLLVSKEEVAAAATTRIVDGAAADVGTNNKTTTTTTDESFRFGTFAQHLSVSTSSSSSLRRPKRDLMVQLTTMPTKPLLDALPRPHSEMTTMVRPSSSNDHGSMETSLHKAPSVYPPNQSVTRIAALEVMPRLTDASNEKTTAAKTKPKQNFVRLNLRNKSGACRGSTRRSHNKSKHPKSSRRFGTAAPMERDEIIDAAARHSTVEGIDPVDDFIDGTFAPPCAAADTTTKTKMQQRSTTTMHLCKGHQEPCKLLKVKKTGPNKGRQFYVCPCPRFEQCDHFQWADDTQEVWLLCRAQKVFAHVIVAVFVPTGGASSATEEQVNVWLYRSSGSRLHEEYCRSYGART